MSKSLQKLPVLPVLSPIDRLLLLVSAYSQKCPYCNKLNQQYGLAAFNTSHEMQIEKCYFVEQLNLAFRDTTNFATDFAKNIIPEHKLFTNRRQNTAYHTFLIEKIIKKFAEMPNKTIYKLYHNAENHAEKDFSDMISFVALKNSYQEVKDKQYRKIEQNLEEHALKLAELQQRDVLMCSKEQRNNLLENIRYHRKCINLLNTLKLKYIVKKTNLNLEGK